MLLDYKGWERLNEAKQERITLSFSNTDTGMLKRSDILDRLSILILPDMLNAMNETINSIPDSITVNITSDDRERMSSISKFTLFTHEIRIMGDMTFTDGGSYFDDIIDDLGLNEKIDFSFTLKAPEDWVFDSINSFAYRKIAINKAGIGAFINNNTTGRNTFMIKKEFANTKGISEGLNEVYWNCVSDPKTSKNYSFAKYDSSLTMYTGTEPDHDFEKILNSDKSNNRKIIKVSEVLARILNQKMIDIMREHINPEFYVEMLKTYDPPKV